MAVTNYYTIDGQMIGYKDAGGRKDFLTDVLGSVTGEVDQTGTNRTFNGRYKPYGRSLWSSGSRGSFGWVGTWGYRQSSSQEDIYIRWRNYYTRTGTWRTVDPIWPNEASYGYVDGRALSFTDRFGQSVDSKCDAGKFSPCNIISDWLKDSKKRDIIKKCVGEVQPKGMLDKILDNLVKACSSKTPKICIFCLGDLPPIAKDVCDLACAKEGEKVVRGLVLTLPENPLLGPFDDFYWPPTKRGQQPNPDCKHGRTRVGGNVDITSPCLNALSTTLKDCPGGSLLLCPGGGAQSALHELIHIIGLKGSEKHDDGHDLVYKISECIKKQIVP